MLEKNKKKLIAGALALSMVPAWALPAMAADLAPVQSVAISSSEIAVPFAESYIDTVYLRIKERDRQAKMTNQPINMQEQILDSWFLARYWILKDQSSHQSNRFISWFKDNLASSRGYDSVAEQMGLKIEAVNDMNVSNIQYTSNTGDTIYRGTSELTNYTSSTQKMKTDSFQKDYTKSQAISVTNGLQLGFKVAAKGVVALAGADFETSVTYNLSTTKTETYTESDKYTVPSQEVTLPPGHKAVVTHDLRKMVYSGTHDLKGDLKITFDDKELVQKFYYPNYKTITLDDARNTINAISQWNGWPKIDLYQMMGPRNYLKNGTTLYIDTPVQFTFNGATPYYRADFKEYDKDGNLVQSKMIAEFE
ncbi:epsilon-toxin family protein [Paenibacillus alvei]|uniref:ETX/MTX2 family pore-forming toxin n=2 Tax=Paenibacillus alvei TaxID=44250 RepID=A0AAP6ZXW3_PAEAL|nr:MULTISPECIES: ETX/MTX2 family pore-forming toxin [Paenibacillus]EJW18716.1 putative mosquitocidal toxin [Paenibacillus alvei DSM 29]MBG9734470.1 mosquitocidal toxin [Paenibacillus alvei]MBG9744226.1 mosquitocidal toxin [Paenibacillus alvei]MCY7487992.1 epsilon-toxin family protein [Paenibacillus alvei]MCY9539894.1 epsilon-toxin family protein [Paenibacillus alvei]